MSTESEPAAPIDAVLAAVSEMLSEGGIDDSRVDAEMLAAHVLGESRGRVQALALMGSSVPGEQCEAILDLARERARRVPLQHLTGRAPFRGIELEVGPGVFVPRPETETVAQFAIDALRAVRDREALVVDLCTGSGAIALAIAHEVAAARVWAVEKSPEAHAWAARNVDELGDGRVELLLGDVLELDPRARTRRGNRDGRLPGRTPPVSDGEIAASAVSAEGEEQKLRSRPRGEQPREGQPSGEQSTGDQLGGISLGGDRPWRGRAGETSAWAEPLLALRGRVDVLVSNPPYVPDSMVPRDPEVRDHDPSLALYGGADGLDVVRAISGVGGDLVRSGGLIVLEHAEQQGRAIRALLEADGWADAQTHVDLTGRDRATVARRR